MSEELEAQEDNTVAQDVQIQMQDIDAIVKIIDVVTTRGAFRGEELESVGGLRRKFVEFLQANVTPVDQTVN